MILVRMRSIAIGFLILISVCDASFHTRAIDLVSCQSAGRCSAETISPLLQRSCFFFSNKRTFTAQDRDFCRTFFGKKRGSYRSGCAAGGFVGANNALSRATLFSSIRNTKMECVDGGVPPPSIQPLARFNVVNSVKMHGSAFCYAHLSFCAVGHYIRGFSVMEAQRRCGTC